MTTVKTFGSKREVWNRTAKKTVGGLTRSDLMKNKKGRIVSTKKHLQGKNNLQYLIDSGHTTEKGKFTLFRKK